MANGIEKATFDKMDVDSKLGVLFDYAQQNIEAIEELKQQKSFHKFCSTAGGVIGGVIAALGIKWLGN